MDDDNLTINTAASISLHPAMIEGIDGVDDTIRPLLQPAIDAFTDAVAGLGAIDDVRKAAKADGTMTDAARFLAVADYSDKRVPVITRKLDAAHASLARSIATTEATLNAPLEASVNSQAAQELRSIVRGMDAPARRKLVMDSINSGDKVVLSALLAAHPIQSGLSQVEMQNYTRMYREKSHPDLMTRLTVLQKAHEMIGARGGSVFTQAEKLIGIPRGELAALRLNNNRMKAALAK